MIRESFLFRHGFLMIRESFLFRDGDGDGLEISNRVGNALGFSGRVGTRDPNIGFGSACS